MKKINGVIYLENNYSKPAYVGIQLADIHFGGLNADSLYNQLKEGVMKTIKELPILDYIIINGDLTDMKLSMNSPHAKRLLQFIHEIKELVLEKKECSTKIRIIKGTDSHDNQQLELLHSILQGSDYKIITTVESEYLFDDFHVLYIPEEYMSDMEEYYKDYLDFSENAEAKYDMICGHGMVNEVAFIAKTQESEITMPKAPIFNTKVLLRNCRGPIFFGHIHTRQTIRERFYYIGSYTRWAFGEEDEKGFYIVSHTPETSNYKIEFKKNKLAMEYVTVEIDVNNSIFKKNNSIVDQVSYLQEIVTGLCKDFIRLKINIPEDYEESQLFTNTVSIVFNKYKNVKLKIINNTKLRKEKQIEDTVNILLDKYSFLFEKNISHEEKICKFIKEKFNMNIPLDRIREYLYNKTNK